MVPLRIQRKEKDGNMIETGDPLRRCNAARVKGSSELKLSSMQSAALNAIIILLKKIGMKTFGGIVFSPSTLFQVLLLIFNNLY